MQDNKRMVCLHKDIVNKEVVLLCFRGSIFFLLALKQKKKEHGGVRRAQKWEFSQ